jgi:pimeloyl-ACP methyl ester carboxylesterase
MSAEDPEQPPRIRRGRGLRLSTAGAPEESTPPEEFTPPADAPPPARRRGLRLSTAGAPEQPALPEEAAPPADSGPTLVRWRIATTRGPLSYLSGGSGAPLLLLHGWGASARIWADVAAALGDLRSLYALDFPGAGETPARVAVPTLDALADEVLAFADMLGLERFDLLGHSLGAATAALLAGRHPERIGRLALLGLGARSFAPELLALDASRLPLDISLGMARPLLNLWQPVNSVLMQIPPIEPGMSSLVLHDRPASRELWHAYLADHAAADARMYLTALTSVADPVLHTALQAVSAPTLCVAAREDRVARLPEATAAQQLIAGSELLVLDDCGHLIMAEQPAALNEALRRFFA